MCFWEGIFSSSLLNVWYFDGGNITTVEQDFDVDNDDDGSWGRERIFISLYDHIPTAPRIASSPRDQFRDVDTSCVSSQPEESKANPDGSVNPGLQRNVRRRGIFLESLGVSECTLVPHTPCFLVQWCLSSVGKDRATISSSGS